MGLRCLLGHDFGEPTVEREREEEGDQVVITVREIEECARCGERRVVSENKEVTTLEQLAAAAAGTDAPAETDSVPDAGTREAADPGATAGTGEPTADVGDVSGAPESADELASAEEPESAGEPASAGGSPETAPSTATASGADADIETSTGSEEDAEIIEGTDGELGGGDETVDHDDGTPGVGEPTGAPTPGTGSGSAESGSVEPGSEPASSSGSESAAEDDGIILTESDEGSDGAGSPTASAEAASSPEAVGANDSVAPDDPSSGPGSSGGSDSPGERERGEWSASDREDRSDGPDAPTVDGDHTPWPERRGEDEGFDATYGDADDEADPAVSFGGGLTPEADGPMEFDDEEAEFIEGSDGRTGSAAAGTAGRSGGSNADVDDPGFTAARTVELATESDEEETEYFCPECGLVQPSGESSMRAGDICPECKRGYIAERLITES